MWSQGKRDPCTGIRRAGRSVAYTFVSVCVCVFVSGRERSSKDKDMLLSRYAPRQQVEGTFFAWSHASASFRLGTWPRARTRKDM
jgi:hypothetical protein